MSGNRLNPFQFALKRSDTFIGNIACIDAEIPFLTESNIVESKIIIFNEGLNNIIREIGSNCIDNNWRSKEANMSMTIIKITFNSETGELSFYNDGFFISTEKKEFDYEDHRTGKITYEKMYPAELYFGDMMASTNYNDEVVRKTSGKNGVGSKLTLIFSKCFKVEHTDPIQGKKLELTFSDNAKSRTKPKLSAYSGKTGWTKITFIPDYERFGYDIESNKTNFINILRLYAAEIAAVSGVATIFTLDDTPPKKFLLNSFDKYTRMFYPDVKQHKLGSIKLPNGDECVVVESHPFDPLEEEMSECQHFSYVNGIRTKLGGVHVNAWRDTIMAAFVRAFNARTVKGGKTAVKTTAKKTYPYLTFFIRMEMDKPAFESQTKQKLNGRHTSEGSKQAAVVADYKIIPTKKLEAANVKEEIETLVNKMLKWNFIPTLEAKLSGKTEKKTLEKIPPSKKITDCANAKEGKPGSTLWISEGLSPKALIVNGVSTIDDRAMDSNGIFAIQGKFLNVKKALQKDIDKNEEIKILRSLIGLWSTKVDFTKDENFKKLRYHHIRLATDMDDDGIHIRGLLINFFYHLYPTLLQRKDFLDSFSTEAVKVLIKGEKEPRSFYSPLEYRKWYNIYSATPDFDPAIMDATYLKGLAAINDEDIPRYFNNQKIVKFHLEGDEEAYFELGFGKTANSADKIAQRKAWIVRDIQPYSEEKADTVVELSEDDDAFVYEGDYGISTFIDHQLVIYHRMALHRALPDEYDGLKESQRKILYAIMKMPGTKTKDLEKVLGYIKTESEYHHGGASVSGAIAGMATRYPGDNNIPYLQNDGQYATRLLGPSEFGADRYIKTHYEPIMKDIFMDIDKPLLEILVCDNNPAEYRHFIPIIHMLSVNGSQGIASGFSTTIPAHNPDDILDYQIAWLDGTHKTLPSLKPWYRGITGPIELIQDKNGMRKWTTEGVLTECIGKGCNIRIGKKKSKCHGKTGWWHITDLPVGYWSDTFNQELEKLSEAGKDKDGNKIPKKISKFHNYCTSNTVHFMIKPAGDWIPDMDKTLKMMKSTHSLNNMVTIDRNHYPTTHKRIEDMIDLWMPKRLRFYDLRKEYLLGLYEHDKVIASNRYIFVKAVAEKKLDMSRPKAEVEKDVAKMGLKKMLIKEVPKNGEELEQEDETKKKKKNEPSYKYLFSMNMLSMTKEKLEKLKKEIDVNEKRIQDLKVISPVDLWKADMTKLRKSWKSFVNKNPLI